MVDFHTGLMVVIVPGSALQSLLAVIIAFFAVMAYVFIRPFAVSSNDYLAMVTQASTFYTFLARQRCGTRNRSCAFITLLDARRGSTTPAPRRPSRLDARRGITANSQAALMLKVEVDHHKKTFTTMLYIITIVPPIFAGLGSIWVFGMKDLVTARLKSKSQDSKRPGLRGDVQCENQPALCYCPHCANIMRECFVSSRTRARLIQLDILISVQATTRTPPRRGPRPT